jgi:hypothetical protein
LCQRVHEIFKSGFNPGPLPHVVAASMEDGFYSIIMMHYNGVGRIIENPDIHGKVIAKAIAEFNDTPVDITSMNRMTSLLRKIAMLTPFLTHLGEFGLNCLEIARAQLSPALGDKVVKSHNDLFFCNFATEACGNSFRVIFIDLGHVAYNNIGADFHHFVRAAHAGTGESSSRRVLEAAINEYSALTGVDRGLILFNAHRYALLRLLERSNRYYEKGRVEQLEKELTTGRKILGACLELQGGSLSF